MLLSPAIFIAWFILPPGSGVENGLVENLQLLILSAGAAAAFLSAQRSENLQGRHIWYSGAVVFLLMIGRELSWGRVFYPEGVSRLDLWYGPFIYPALGVVSVILAAVLVRNRIDRYVVRRGVPVYDFAIFAVFFLLSVFLNHQKQAGFPVPGDVRLLEELAECVCYWALVSIVYLAGIEKSRAGQAQGISD